MLPIPERNRAAGFPPEVVDYSHWNAHSIFFLDPAGTVVEYIARHDLKNADQRVQLDGHSLRERDWAHRRRRRGHC
jgi:catechol-2,3-dioxygenase